MKHVWALAVLALLSCAHGNENREAAGEDSEATRVQDAEQVQETGVVGDEGVVPDEYDPYKMQDDDLNDESIFTKKSLNDIRFGDWKDNDWLDNEYVRVLRRHIDDFNAGKVEDENLEPYAEFTKCQFAIMYVEPFLGGGLSIQITFLDLPNRSFSAWVYSFVDEENERVTGYDFRSINIRDEEIDFTKEEILKIAAEHPECSYLW